MTGEEEQVIASFKTLLHKIELTDEYLYLSRKLPPASRTIKYKDIATVEHKRLPDYGRLTWVAVAAVLSMGRLRVFDSGCLHPDP